MNPLKLTYRIENLTNVTVIDDLTGTGKTTLMLQFINEAPLEKKFIFVSPYLDECKRVIKNTRHTRRFCEPSTQNKSGSKLESFKQLLMQSENIVTTHSLFSMWDNDVMQLIRLGNYTLIMDETAEVIEQMDVISKSDMKILINQRLISVDDSSQRIDWMEEDYKGEFDNIMTVAKTGRMYLHDYNCVIWSYPADMFRAFKEVFIMTYLFEGSLLKCYFDLHKISYSKMSVGIKDEIGHVALKLSANGELSHRITPKYELIDYRKPDIQRQKELIQILDHPKLNSIGDSKNKNGYDLLTFSKMDKLTKDSTLAKQIDNNLENVFRHQFGCSVEESMWTCNKKLVDSKILGKGRRKAWVASNIRATNQYRHKTGCAFIRNVYVNPTVANFFESRGIEVDHDTYALSVLIQWVYRSAVRDGNQIQLYLPSQRMRGLFMDWLYS